MAPSMLPNSFCQRDNHPPNTGYSILRKCSVRQPDEAQQLVRSSLFPVNKPFAHCATLGLALLLLLLLFLLLLLPRVFAALWYSTTSVLRNMPRWVCL
ncbi:hypothetical protein L209DRAFT_758143 [Thermothelomyces heterothallicus CBS 203.75]